MVDLPEPFGPVIAWTLPGAKAKSNLLKIHSRLKRLLNPCVIILKPGEIFWFCHEPAVGLVVCAVAFHDAAFRIPDEVDDVIAFCAAGDLLLHNLNGL